MGSSQSNTKKNKSGCLKTTIVGVGCFFVYLFIFVAITCIILYVLFGYPCRMIVQQPNIQELALPDESDFYKLQEKILEAKSGDSKVRLSLAEYNAYLNKIPTYISYGFCVQKVRFNIEQNKPIVYVFGSGYFNRSLIIRIQYENFGLNNIEIVSWNKFQVPPSGITKHISNFLLNKILNIGSNNCINEIINKNFPVLDNGKILIRVVD